MTAESGRKAVSVDPREIEEVLSEGIEGGLSGHDHLPKSAGSLPAHRPRPLPVSKQGARGVLGANPKREDEDSIINEL